MGNQNCRSAFYFKELARKRNFKNLTKSSAERCQLKECGNFSDVDEAPQSSMESMAIGKCTPENFCYVQVCTLDYDSCAESARYVGSVKDLERSGGCIEKGENLISCDLDTQ